MKTAGWVLLMVAVGCGLGAAVLRSGGPGEVSPGAWIGLAGLALGLGVGAAWARTRRGWDDWQYTRRQVPITRRIFLANLGTLIKWTAVVGILTWIAVIGMRAG